MRTDPTRRGMLLGGGGLLGAGLALGAYGTVIEPGLRLAVAEHRVAMPAWPATARLRIVALADLHCAAPMMPLGRVEAIVARANGLRPDLVALLGDYVASAPPVTQRWTEPEIARALAGLRAPLGVHAILGNHDWWEDWDAVRAGHPPRMARALEEAGIPVLRNAGVALRAPGGAPFRLLGLDSQWALGAWRGRDDLSGTLARQAGDAPAVLLAHEPDIFAAVPAEVAVTLSGHTHGGQVRLFGHSLRVPSRYGNRFAWGKVEEAGRTLVVSGGLGVSILPVRIGVPPEITVVTLEGVTPAG
jgi:predicted MPP superfamily phosphohydrolase